MASKYLPLRNHLQRLWETERTVTMTFDAVDRLVGGIPPSALKHREWWANGSHGHALSWLEAGYLVGSVDLRARWVSFHATGARGSAPLAVDGKEPRQGIPRTDLDQVAVSIHFRWQSLGWVRLDAEGRVAFPETSRVPAIYRFTVMGTASARSRVYVGETEDLRQRVYGYRRPGPSQYTNQRLNALMTTHLSSGDHIDLAVALEVTASTGQHEFSLDLSRKSSRLLAENAALVTLRSADAVEIENLG